jgi:hypothetical protein
MLLQGLIVFLDPQLDIGRRFQRSTARAETWRISLVLHGILF